MIVQLHRLVCRVHDTGDPDHCILCRAAARDPGPHRGPGGHQQLDGEGGPGPGLPRAAAEHLRHLTPPGGVLVFYYLLNIVMRK